MADNIISIQAAAPAANVTEYTKEDFLNGEAPYAELFKLKDNKFKLQQALAIMRDKAGAVGVKNFLTLWKCYLEAHQQQKGGSVAVDHITEFTGQPIELFAGKYTCDDMGVAIVDDYGFERVVCMHPIIPVRRLVNIDSGEERLELAFAKGSRWRSVTVEKAMLASTQRILDLAAFGVCVNSENAKELSSYLFAMEQQNYDDIPEQMSTSRLGWIQDHGFAPYTDNLTFDGNENYRRIFDAVGSKGDRQAWLEAMRGLRAERGAGRIFLAASFASVLVDLCHALPFFVHGWGTTGAGKSVGIMVAASVWGNPKIGEFATTFNSTQVGQEATAAFLNSLPMCVDELQIMASAGLKDFDKMIYQLTEGVGKARGTRRGGLQKQNTWRNCFITNGERPISNSNSNGGAVNRIIEFEVTKDVAPDMPALCDIITHNYGHAGQEFVEWLMVPENAERAVALQKQFYAELLDEDSTQKQAGAASVLLAADSLITELFFQDDNGLTVADLRAIMTTREAVDVNARGLDYLNELVARNMLHFTPENWDRVETWGKITGEYVDLVKSVFDREMQNAGFNPTAFVSWANRRGILRTDAGRTTKVCNIQGGSVRCISIKLDFQREATAPQGYYHTEEAYKPGETKPIWSKANQYYSR